MPEAPSSLAADAFIFAFPLVFNLSQVTRFTESGIGGASGNVKLLSGTDRNPFSPASADSATVEFAVIRTGRIGIIAAAAEFIVQTESVEV